MVLVDLLGQLEIIDVRLLMALDEAGEALRTSEVLGVSEGVAQMLNAKLLSLALVETEGMSFRTLHGAVRLATLGREALAVFRSNGDPRQTE
jgi:hypothetical protein